MAVDQATSFQNFDCSLVNESVLVTQSIRSSNTHKQLTAAQSSVEREKQKMLLLLRTEH